MGLVGSNGLGGLDGLIGDNLSLFDMRQQEINDVYMKQLEAQRRMLSHPLDGYNSANPFCKKKPDTILAELQADTDEWLKDVKLYD